MPTTCVCFRPDCATNGCVKNPEHSQFNPMRASTMLWSPSKGTHAAPEHSGCQPLKQLTEADIRRIVREEIANAMSSGVKP